MPSALPSSRTRWWSLAILGLTQLMVVLDGTIVAIALPAAQADLGMADGQRQWVVTAYAVSFSALLLLGGRIADFWGRKRAFMVGMVGFGVASAWGGLAQSGGELIAARGLQGVFAALLAPSALAMVSVLFPSGRDRNVAFAVFGIIAGTGAAFGFLLGGALTQYADWRWCLLVNLVFVVAGLIGGKVLLVESKAEGDTRYDIVGTVIVALSLGALIYGFARAEHGWDEPETWGFLAVGAGLMGVFVWWQSRTSHPLLPLRVVRDRVRGGAFLLQAMVGVVMVGAMLYLTFHFQIVLGMSPLMAGFGNVAMTVVIMATAPISTTLFTTFGPRVVLTVGPLLAAAGLFFLSGITAEGSYWSEVLPGLVVMGLGFSLIFVPVQNLALSGVDAHDAGVASAMANASMHVGGSIAVAVFTALYSSAMADALAQGTERLPALAGAYGDVLFAAAWAMILGAATSFVLFRGSKPEVPESVDAVATAR
ncbi:MFS transporter [Aeromicrobium duanguangcaii]|uniref:MFS transporter n=1 Tax=Aeromicrobium duanguangcaii TaxID=2968086 RepID=A0ABY5KFX2_9ACTN|nr:MFS transporter [Aeromicrobium duanguangcaii]MCD9153541.1 MFS transporter [Aeromicrobium duanguangcaii]MCL3836474.1 MFS transporter [Aeromicrobium duanguangcaii]UUI69372.1 MFS transporter [Aeromicrobium duanguangcaii]